MRIRLLWLILWAACTAMAPGSVQAAVRYALIVGVTKYDNLEKTWHLTGPQNDAALVAGVLEQWGFSKSNITVLAEEPAGSRRPTRKAIMNALADLAATAKKGDFVYLHFSGHGSQQPASPVDTEEEDGMDEIFLPADIGRWNGDLRSVEGAITDNELDAARKKIQNKGAFVWMVFDTCHSGTMTRGVPRNDLKLRKVAPSILGVTDATSRPAKAGADVASVELRAEAGGYVAFFAVHPNEATPEMKLPKGAEDRRVYGLFTHTLMTVLSTNFGITYRQAFQQVLKEYAAGYYPRHNPMLEGTARDAPVFGSKASERVRQWKIVKSASGLEVPAGSLHRIGEGAVLAVLPDAVAKEETALGYLKVTQAGAFWSRAASFAYRSKPALKEIPDGAYARLVDARFSLDLRIARPTYRGPLTKTQKKVQAVLREIEEAQKNKVGGLALTWVEPEDDADLRLAIEESAKAETPVLWFLPPSGELVRDGPQKPLSIGLGASPADLLRNLEESFHKIAKVTNLLRLGTWLLGGDERETALDVTVLVRRARKTEDVDNPVCAEEAEEYGMDDFPTLRVGDCIRFAFTNQTVDSWLDVTALYIDSQFGIDLVYPAKPGAANRIPPGGKYESGTFRITPEPLGLERLLTIAVRSEKDSDLADFSFLVQKRLPKTRGGKGRQGLFDLFADAGFSRTKTRGLASDEPAVERTEMRIFNWMTAPRPRPARAE